MGKIKDRRKHKRYYLKALLQIEEAGEYSNVTLESINISAGGLLIRSGAEVGVGEVFSLLFSLPGHDQPIRAECEVIHHLEAIPGKQYFVGAKFLKLEGIDSGELERILKERFEDTYGG
jgi:c-di-GMP-binding flagellar brake protein YcgR